MTNTDRIGDLLETRSYGKALEKAFGEATALSEIAAPAVLNRGLCHHESLGLIYNSSLEAADHVRRLRLDIRDVTWCVLARCDGYHSYTGWPRQFDAHNVGCPTRMSCVCAGPSKRKEC